MHYFDPLIRDNLPDSIADQLNRQWFIKRENASTLPQIPWPPEAVKILSAYFTRVWKGRKVKELMAAYNKESLISSGVIAAVNAWYNQADKLENCNLGMDFKEFLNLSAKQTVGLIGYFYPVVDYLRTATDKIYIFELEAGENFIEPEKQSVLLPQCDVVICTGSTLVNGTFAQVMQNISPKTMVTLVGPTVPLIPKVFRETKIDYLAGSIVVNSELLLERINAGQGGRDLKKCLIKAVCKV
ncbi:MAG: Rossmann-like domain-containing protein [Myxococcota bacterium]